ncbi:AAA family ATPase [Streptomyces yaizuensis]|uniref:AAA family ATPase n=1 Tax=Streptomyces yaizuensis TaxID=2989713 RepID=A0ABQ5P0T3_9ACTN|nr:helix-hairpin-helix domain-containing protein [Streptomyces sp. YSPA8]GLF96221.1 AAA family ATPase [Streptomyces sp. YSPA8]
MEAANGGPETASEGADEAVPVPTEQDQDQDEEQDEEQERPGAPAADTSGTEAAADAGAVSEAQAELAAQRELRERIERRKAERGGPVTAGAKLSGTAADLLAAVRAVESGDKHGGAFFEPAPGEAPAARSAAPVREPQAARAARSAPAPRPVARPAASPEAVAATGDVLREGGAPEALAAGAVAALGEQAAGVLREDPWQLLSVPGVRPEQADGFARALLGDACAPEDERRTNALVTWRLESAALEGHTALAVAAVRGALAERRVPDPDGALERAIAEGAVLAFQDGPGDPAEQAAGEDGPVPDPDEDGQDPDGPIAEAAPVLLGLDRYALAEESLADGLARLARAGADARWEAADPTELVRAVTASGLVAHTGGEAARAEPVALARAAAQLGLRPVVAVHGEHGRAAVGPAAVTVTGLLTDAQGPGRDADGALALDLLVVLDAQLLDVEGAAMLVESLPDGARLVLSGDPGQLGAAGAGRVFGDLLAAAVCPRVVSRTPDPGPIGELVSGIGVGELTRVEAPGKEVVIVPVRDAGEAVHRTVQLVADSVPRAIGVPADRTQVITVGHGGSAGTRALNAALKQRLNPGPGRFAGFDPGDRVAHSPAPGRTVPGTVVSADAEGLRLECAGERVTVPRERVAASLRHGWALTAHQAVGLRWPAVVVVLPGDAAPGLSRPWVYTAFSRGERHLSVVHGVDQALPRAVAEIPAQPRTTRLQGLLTSLLEPAG